MNKQKSHGIILGVGRPGWVAPIISIVWLTLRRSCNNLHLPDFFFFLLQILECFKGYWSAGYDQQQAVQQLAVVLCGVSPELGTIGLSTQRCQIFKLFFSVVSPVGVAGVTKSPMLNLDILILICHFLALPVWRLLFPDGFFLAPVRVGIPDWTSCGRSEYLDCTP